MNEVGQHLDDEIRRIHAGKETHTFAEMEEAIDVITALAKHYYQRDMLFPILEQVLMTIMSYGLMKSLTGRLQEALDKVAEKGLAKIKMVGGPPTVTMHICGYSFTHTSEEVATGRMPYIERKLDALQELYGQMQRRLGEIARDLDVDFPSLNADDYDKPFLSEGKVIIHVDKSEDVYRVYDVTVEEVEVEPMEKGEGGITVTTPGGTQKDVKVEFLEEIVGVSSDELTQRYLSEKYQTVIIVHGAYRYPIDECVLPLVQSMYEAGPQLVKTMISKILDEESLS